MGQRFSISRHSQNFHCKALLLLSSIIPSGNFVVSIANTFPVLLPGCPDKLSGFSFDILVMSIFGSSVTWYKIVVGDAKEADKLREETAAYNDFMQTTNDILAWKKQNAFGAISPTETSRMEQLATLAKGSLTKLEAQGHLSPRLIAAFKQSIPDNPANFDWLPWRASVEPIISSARDQVTASMNSAIKSMAQSQINTTTTNSNEPKKSGAVGKNGVVYGVPVK